MWFNEYPYINVNDLNLDFILKVIRNLKYEVENFVSINAIKYADPIQWSITRQYEKNTVVIDPVSGTAYLSVAPVPAGVALNRTEFWTVVFDLGAFVTKANQNLANNYEAATTTTATMNTNAGAWVVWGDVLYKALVNITAGDAYVVGSNIERITIEDVIKEIVQNFNTAIANIAANIGDLDDLVTTDKSSIVNAINEEVQARIDAVSDEAQLRIDADNTLQNEIDNIDASIYVNVRDFGATGDGVTDDTQAIQSAVSYAHTSGKNKVFIPSGTYMIKCHDDNYPYGAPYNPYGMVGHDDPDRHYGVTLYSDIELYLDEGAICKSIQHDRPESVMFRACEANNIYIHGGHLIGEANTHVSADLPLWGTSDEWNHGITLAWCTNCRIEDIEIEGFHGTGLEVGAKYSPDMASYTYNDYMTYNIIIHNCYLHHNWREGAQIGHGRYFNISACKFKNNQAYGSPYGGGLGIEGESYGTLGIYEYVNDVSVDGCVFEDTGLYGSSCSDCRKVTYTNCYYENQNISAQCYRNARTIRFDNCVLTGKTYYGGFRLVDNGIADIGIQNCVVNNGRIQLEHGTQTADTSIYNVFVRGCLFNNFIITNDDPTDLYYFDFSDNIIQSSVDLKGTLVFRNITYFNILNNVLFSDNSSDIVTLTISTALRGNIKNNKFMRSGGAFISVNKANTVNVTDNEFGNGNVAATRAFISLVDAERCNVSGNRFIPNLSHANGTQIYMSGAYINSIIDNVILTEAGSGDTPVTTMINVDGTKKIIYGNKAKTGAVTNLLAGSNLASIVDDVTNATF